MHLNPLALGPSFTILLLLILILFLPFRVWLLLRSRVPIQ
jgi:hypothetical protein